MGSKEGSIPPWPVGLTLCIVRALLQTSLKPSSSERERLIALLAALEDPSRGGALSPDDPDLPSIARHHRLSPLLSITCGETLPAPLGAAFRRDRIVTTARNMMLGQVAEECLRAFRSAGVRTIVLKGLDYETRLYGAPGARPTADVDLLVPDEGRRAAFGVLDRLGFEPRAAAPGFDEPDYHEVAWTRAGIEVDLHMALAPLARCRIDYGAIWREAQPFRLGVTDGLVLARRHAAIFHALHMAIDHFDVPAIYLTDLARLLPDEEAIRSAGELAGRWRCRRPLDTSVALTAAFLPRWRRAAAPATDFAPMRSRIVARYGTALGLSRPEQLARKLAHFDGLAEAVRYVITQSRRNLREQLEGRLHRRSARERLNLSAADPGIGAGRDP
jgi:hypothetical protein